MNAIPSRVPRRKCFKVCSYFLVMSTLPLTHFLFVIPTNTETTVSVVVFSLGSIIAISVTCGWQMMKNRITAKIVDFVELVELRTFNTVMIVECALTRVFILITTAKAASTSPTVQCAKNSCSVHEVHPMKCPVAMPFIGSVFDNWLPMIHAVQYARRQLKPGKG